jgi:pentatricopeptide repeat protein
MQVDERIEGMAVKIKIGKQGAKAYRVAIPPAATCCDRNVQIGHGALEACFDAAIIITLQGWLRWGLVHLQPLEALPGQVKPGIDEPFQVVTWWWQGRWPGLMVRKYAGNALIDALCQLCSGDLACRFLQGMLAAGSLQHAGQHTHDTRQGHHGQLPQPMT